MEEDHSVPSMEVVLVAQINNVERERESMCVCAHVYVWIFGRKGTSGLDKNFNNQNIRNGAS